MWEQQPQQQNQVYDHERVGYFTSSRGGGGFMTYSEDDTLSNVSGRITAAGGAFQDAQVKGFIEEQRGDDVASGRVASGAGGVQVYATCRDGFEIWTLYLDANGNVVRAPNAFLLT